LLKIIEENGTMGGNTKEKILIADCGQIKTKQDEIAEKTETNN